MIGRLWGIGWRHRLPVLQPLDQLVDPELRLPVGRFDITIEPRVADDADHMLEVIEHEHGVDELKECFG